MAIDAPILSKAQTWLDGNYDEQTKQEIRQLLATNETELIDSFYKDLEFGTGGLRGIMGVGSNRMNKYTVGMATQGLANYLKQCYPNQPISVVIAYDCRNNNTFFAQVSADVLSANGIKTYVFEGIRPTPELSFAVRHLGCQSGIVITASHNPKEYNGYKVYWADGGQLVNPHDENTIKEVQKITSIDEVNFNANANLIVSIGEEVDAVYIDKITTTSLNSALNKKHNDLKFVYTPIHGTGVNLVPRAMKAFGFTQVYNVPEQDIIDGNFPTVASPNPEEKSALDMAIKKAEQVGADIVMATDPDADRVGIAVRDLKGDFILLNGNQTAALVTYYLISQWKKNNKLTGNQYIVKTIVTTELLKDMAVKNKIDYYDVLTGFKYIAEILHLNEGKKEFICGGEESYGFLVGDFVRDKDAVVTCCIIAETAAWAKEQNKTLFDLLIDIYEEYGLYKEHLKNVVKKGKAGAEAIQAMMDDYRTNPLEEINGIQVLFVKDYQLKIQKDMVSGAILPMDDLPKSNVIQFVLADGTYITVRPSGTEPKIKYYIGVKADLRSKEEFDTTNQLLDKKIQSLMEAMGLNS